MRCVLAFIYPLVHLRYGLSKVCGRYATAHLFFPVYMLASLAFIHDLVRLYASAFHGILVTPRLTTGIHFPIYLVYYAL